MIELNSDEIEACSGGANPVIEVIKNINALTTLAVSIYSALTNLPPGQGGVPTDVINDMPV